MLRQFLCSIFVVVASSAIAAADEPTPSAEQKPQWQRMLQGADAEKAADLQKRIDAAEQADMLDDAVRLHEELLSLRTRAQGADHWQAVYQRLRLDNDRSLAVLNAKQRADWRRALAGGLEARQLQAKTAYSGAEPLFLEVRRLSETYFGEKNISTATAYGSLAGNLYNQEKYGDAQPFFEKALELRHDLFGEKHPYTADSYIALADNFEAQGRYAEAEPLFRKALDVRIELLGEKNIETARSYSRLASNLGYRQRKHVDAEPMYRKALDLAREVLGEQHAETAALYMNLADNIEAQSRCAEAQPFYQTALDLKIALFGERHHDTALSYSALASNLGYGQSKYAEAEPHYRKALEVAREVLGERHHETLACYNNLAGNLEALDRCNEAEPLYRRSLELARELFGEEHLETANCYSALAENLWFQDKYAEAQPLYETALSLRLQLVGERHAETARSYDYLADNFYDQRKYAEAQPLYEKALQIRLKLFDENDPEVADSYYDMAQNLGGLRRFAEAEPLFEKVRDIRIRQFGEMHEKTADSYSELASNLQEQGKHREAEPVYRKALELTRNVLGEAHLDTATRYNNLAGNLDNLGKYAEAELLYRKSLELKQALLGPDDPVIAASYSNLSVNLANQGRHAESFSLAERALVIWRSALGEAHPDTILGYSNLAGCLSWEGRYDEANSLYQRALDLCLEIYGEKHPETADGYCNLASSLADKRRYREAEPYYRKALELRVELFGEKHPDTATSYSVLARNLYDLHKYAEAQRFYQKALDVRLQLFGERHPETTSSYKGLAANLARQGMRSEAKPLFEKALELRRELFGEKHDDTGGAYYGLAYNCAALGEYHHAAQLLESAAASYEANRLIAARRTVERAVYGDEASPYVLLAAMRVRLRDSKSAWETAELDLARGLNDENAARRGATLRHDETSRQAALNQRLNELQSQVLKLALHSAKGDGDKSQSEELERERRMLEAELSELAVSMSKREIATRADIQIAIPTDGAIVYWIDIGNGSTDVEEHWGCVVRSTGEPHWERLRGTGPNSEWTKADWDLPWDFGRALASNTSATDIAEMSSKVYQQRLFPLKKHLDGVTRLYVVAVNEMARIPVQVLTDDYVVSDIPSGTFLAKLRDRPTPTGQAMFAVGDPIFPVIKPSPEPLPPGGLLVLQALPEGIAEGAGFKSGDVLLEYAGEELSSEGQLDRLVQAHSGEKTVAITAWREGTKILRDLPPGEMGVVVDRQLAPDAIVARREADKMLLAIARGGDWSELPGSAVEVSRIKVLAGDGQATILTRSQASEQELERLRASGELEKFRFLHFATHGEPNNKRSFQSALILSQDHITSDIPPAGEKYYDGRLTANEVLENWKLNADLVTLSACESALGRPGGGDGLLGFAQAFLLAGARAVCLSLWKVDDTTTALLMDRFYQNLLGKRADLDQPMPKAAALAEAKHWLHELSLDEATKLAAKIASGVSRAKNQPALNLVVPAAKPATENTDETRPFSHPRYWAAFILIGDPD